jgi:membrane associated rhomboid family serine protease
MKQLHPAILTLIGINALLFAPGLLNPQLENAIIDLGALYYFQNEAFQIWQLVSHMFLHGGVAHIFFNMFALASFGLPLTMIWGWRRFLIFYFVTGIGAGLVQTAVHYYQFSAAYESLTQAGFSGEAITFLLQEFKADPAMLSKVPEKTIEQLISIYHGRSVGASGAIYGVLVAFGILFPNAKLSLIFLPIPVAAKYFIPALVLLDLFSGVTGFSIFGGGIAHFAHVGGALIGFLMMLYWKAKPIQPHPGVG